MKSLNRSNRDSAAAAALPAIPRRTFLAGIAALSASTFLPGCATDSKSAAATGGKAFRIDTHHHHIPPNYLASIPRQRGGGKPPVWTPAKSLEDMDQNGIATSITSIIPDGVWFNDVALARRLARECNDYAARLARDYPGRYGIFASLALPDIEGSLKEIEYSADVLKADGFALMTSFGDKYPGDPSFWPVLEELNRRKAIVYTHPLTCCGNPVAQWISSSAIEYTADTTRAIASLLFSGAAARYPDILWIFSHGGGVMPFVYSRFTRQEASLSAAERAKLLPNGVEREVRKFYYETAQANHPGALAALLKVAPLSQVLFGTDFPFRPGSEEVDGLAAYGFTASDLAAIERGNALRLLPRWNV